MYINWKAYSPTNWKIGTLKGLIRRAHIICSEREGIDKELEFLKTIFCEVNGYPKKVVEDTIKLIEEELTINNDVEVENGMNSNTIQVVEHPYMVLPYTGKTGDNIMRSFKKCLSKYLPSEVVPRLNYKGKKLASFFRVKDKTSEEHCSSLIYRYNCQLGQKECNYISNYIGETKVRHGTRTHEHTVDQNSAIFKHGRVHGHSIDDSNFEILATGYDKTVDRKIAEALYIKDLKPNLNKQIIHQKLWLFK